MGPGDSAPRRPPSSLGASGDAEPGRHLPCVQAREQAEEQQQLWGHGAVERGTQGPRPRAARGFLRVAGLASAGSPCPRCLRCRRPWRDSGAGPPRRDRCGLWRPAAPPTAGGSARGSAWLTRDTRSPRRTAPARARAPGPRSQQAGAGGRGRSPAQKTRGPQQPAPRAAARAVGTARAVRPPCAPGWGRGGGRYSGSDSEEAPAGWSSPNYMFDNARGEES